MVTRDVRILRCRMRKVNALCCAFLVAIAVAVAHAQDDSQPIARADENSRIAHRQLVDKARRGGIDVYFTGDSITRRGGTSDAAYRPFLDNWTRNFFGWNAANFGWGGDTVQNVLWRLTEGELDGVHPKVIVVMAGTNNVGGTPREGVDHDAPVSGDGAVLVRVAPELAERVPGRLQHRRPQHLPEAARVARIEAGRDTPLRDTMTRGEANRC